MEFHPPVLIRFLIPRLVLIFSLSHLAFRPLFKPVQMGLIASKPVLSACAAASASVVWLACRPLYVWKLRNIPGPRKAPLLGHLGDILKAGDFPVWSEQMARKYGPVYKAWQGGLPFVVINDAKLGRKLLMTLGNRPSLTYFAVLVGDVHDITENIILAWPASSDKFKVFRKMYEAALLKPISLVANAGMLAECATRLVLHLDTYAASGQPVDMAVCASMMSLTAIGFAAFGVDFDCFKNASAGTSLNQAAEAADAAGDAVAAAKTLATPQLNGTAEPEQAGKQKQTRWCDAPIGSAQFSDGLVDACLKVAKASDLSNGSPWKVLNILFPSLCRPISHLANWLPDRPLREELKARKETVVAIRNMIAKWKDQQKTGMADDESMSKRGFLACMMEQAEQGCSEVDIVAQAITMVFAGFETTAVSIAHAARMMATHPEVQARAQQELDTVLQGRAPVAADFEKLPYTCALWDEVLRMYAPANASVRQMYKAEDVEVDGKTLRIPPCSLMINHYAIHRDPDVWGRPDEFMPERFLPDAVSKGLAPENLQANYFPFGVGQRMCVGYKFATLEGRLAIAKMLQVFSFGPAPGCPPTKMNSGIVYSPDHVWVTVTRRK